MGRLGGDELPVALRVGAEMRIDVVISRPIVFVRRRRIENWVEVDGFDAQINQIVETVDDALQIAAVAPPLDVEPDVAAVALLIGLAFVPAGRPGVDLPGRGVVVGPGPLKAGGGWVVVGVAVAESFGEYLVPDDAFGPLGHELVVAHRSCLIFYGSVIDEICEIRECVLFTPLCRHLFGGIVLQPDRIGVSTPF